MTKNEGFVAWWVNEGSKISPLPGENLEEYSRRIAAIAWCRPVPETNFGNKPPHERHQ